MSSQIDELYHRCRWCRHFNNGQCTIADEVFEIPNIKEELDYAIDDGGLSEAIHETIESHLTALTYSQDDEDEKESVISEIVSEIETAVRNLQLDHEDGLEVKDPSCNDHYCKRFE